MHSKQLFALLLSLSTIVLQVAGDCALDSKYITSSNRVFLLKDINGNYELLLRDSVPNGQKLYLVCNENQIDVVECDAAGNIILNLPTSSCQRPSAVVKEIVAAGLAPNFKMYSVGFNVGNTFVELFHTVYSPSTVTAMYSVYKSYTGNMVTPRPNQDFTTDRIISGKDAASFSKQSVLGRFNELFGVGQTYIRNAVDSIIERGHLSPVADFLFEQDMRATFKFINVVAQFGSINRGNWGSIESWVRQHSGNLHVPYRVLTGASDVLDLPQTSNNNIKTIVYLLSGNKNPVPKWMYKLVEKQGRCTAFITYNNIYDTNKPTTICNEIDCPIKLNTVDMTKGYTYCCDAKDFQQRIIPNVNFC